MEQEVANELNKDVERLASFFRKSQPLLKRGEFLTVDCQPSWFPKDFDLLNWVILPRDESKITVCLQKSVFESLELFTLEWRPVIFVYEKSLLLSLDRVSKTCKVESGKEGARLEFGKPVEFNIKPFIDQIISQDRLGGVV
jgi:hypothetical protein